MMVCVGPPVLWAVLAHAPPRLGPRLIYPQMYKTVSTNCTWNRLENSPRPCLVFCGGFATRGTLTPSSPGFLSWLGGRGQRPGCSAITAATAATAAGAGRYHVAKSEIRGSNLIVRVTARVRSGLRSARVTLDLGVDLKLHLTLVNVDCAARTRTFCRKGRRLTRIHLPLPGERRSEEPIVGNTLNGCLNFQRPGWPKDRHTVDSALLAISRRAFRTRG